MIRPGRGWLLHVDAVDVLLVASVVEYTAQVRDLLRRRRRQRDRLAAAGAFDTVTQPPGPDYAAESVALVDLGPQTAHCTVCEGPEVAGVCQIDASHPTRRASPERTAP